jgi:hypothetical protein
MTAIPKSSIPAKTLKALEKFPVTTGRAVRNFVLRAADTQTQLAITKADPGVRGLDLQKVELVSYTADSMDFQATYRGKVADERREYTVPMHMELPALQGLKASIAGMMKYGPDDNFQAARAKSPQLASNPRLEAQIKGALGDDADYVAAVTTADGSTYVGPRFDTHDSHFNYHPGQPKYLGQPPVVGLPGRIYVTTDCISFLSGDRTLHVLAPKDGTLVIEKARTLVMS